MGAGLSDRREVNSDHVLGKKKKADQAKEGRGKPKDCGMKLGSRSDHQRSSCRILGCL